MRTPPRAYTATECGACHADRHAGQFVGRKCVECHAGAAWKPTPGFDHGKTFVLKERHAAIACVRCHPTTSIAGVAVEVYKLGKPALACAGCHRDQHGDASSPRAQPRALAMATRACASCHVESTWKAIARAPVFDHATTGAPLAGGHARVACATCHKLGGRALPALEACASCHADRHAGRLGERCESCHSATSWKQDRILVDHQRTRLPLLGAHAVQGCPTCHKDVAPDTFRGLSPNCGGCHQHTLEERRPHPRHEGTAFARCEDCHSSLGWRPSQFNHDRFWALTGKHQSTPCSKCHKSGEPYSAAPTRCNGCHADIDHQGLGSLGLECQQCHTTTSWNPSTFNHTPFFPIGGKHRGITCGTCHTVKNVPAMFSCIIAGACHTNNHHPDQGSSGCYRCHPNGQGGD
ncbi:MAG: cytochrome c3 family protein [Proteobacteria bacterium]|nr:cytochrome c3 family protein [Pseudomonadota bacterium]